MLMEQPTPQNSKATNVLVKNNILLAILSPIGYRSEWGAVLGYLKATGGADLPVERSELEFLDAEREILETRANAFGIKDGTNIKGPYSERFSDDSRRSESAATVRWRLNHMQVETGLIEPEGIELRVIYLPLQVEKEKDPHIVITVINRSEEMLNIADGVRNAVCVADGKRFGSNTGGHWDGSYELRPGRATTRQFNLNDFPGIPRTGKHEMSFEILGFQSEPDIVEWKGVQV